MSATVLDLEDRTGITVYVREVIPGDLMRDGGLWRTVAQVVESEVEERASVVVFEPLEGARPSVGVPNRIQVYVLRGCVS